MAAMIKIVTLGEAQAHVVMATRQGYLCFKKDSYLLTTPVRKKRFYSHTRTHHNNRCPAILTIYTHMQIWKVLEASFLDMPVRTIYTNYLTLDT